MRIVVVISPSVPTSMRTKIARVEEVVSDTGNPIGALDALSALCDAGLVHRQGNFVFATRPAIHFFQLVA